MKEPILEFKYNYTIPDMCAFFAQFHPNRQQTSLLVLNYAHDCVTLCKFLARARELKLHHFYSDDIATEVIEYFEGYLFVIEETLEDSNHNIYYYLKLII